MIVTVEASPESNTKILVMNAVEDLKHDYGYFIKQAKKTSPADEKTMFLHQRWLRAALFTLLAYIEAEVNRFLYRALKNRNVMFLFGRVEKDPLHRKVDLLHELMPSTTKKLDIEAAKAIRNLWIHSKPDNEEKAFEDLTLKLIEQAGAKIETWVAEAEGNLGIKRHESSANVSRPLSKALGRTLESAGTGRRHYKSKRQDS